MDKSRLLDRCGALGDDRVLLARVLDRAQQAGERNIPSATDFLSPAQQVQAMDLLHAAGIPETAYVRWGGYDGAERVVLQFLPDWMEPEDAAAYSPIRCLRAGFRGEEKLTHRDFLGSLMAKLRVAEIDPGCVHIPEIHFEERRDTVSSLRLDAVCSTGFRMARGKAAELIESGRVQLNWRECTKPDKAVSAGDTVSARGFGKFELAEVGSLTKKGRIPIVVKCYK